MPRRGTGVADRCCLTNPADLVVLAQSGLPRRLCCRRQAVHRQTGNAGVIEIAKVRNFLSNALWWSDQHHAGTIDGTKRPTGTDWDF
jgi:hypothetical protein